jgi:hypothetical protein
MKNKIFVGVLIIFLAVFISAGVFYFIEHADALPYTRTDSLGTLPLVLQSNEEVLDAIIFAYMDCETVPLEIREIIYNSRRVVSHATFDAVAPYVIRESFISDERLWEAVTYAYLCLENANDRLRERILEARSILIFSGNAWYNDNVIESGSVYMPARDPYTLELLYKVPAPAFSYLFPGWDIPSLK